MRKRIIFALIVLFGILAHKANAQLTRRDSIVERFIYEIDRERPLPPNVKEMVQSVAFKETMRYKMALYPPFAKMDSLLTDSLERKRFRENPFVLLAPDLKGYVYDPILWVERFRLIDIEDSKEALANLYTVIKADRFIRPAAPEETQQPDTIVRDLSCRIFEYDMYFAVYCSPLVGDCFMVGGNAFLRNIPYARFRGTGRDADIVGSVAVKMLAEIKMTKFLPMQMHLTSHPEPWYSDTARFRVFDVHYANIWWEHSGIAIVPAYSKTFGDGIEWVVYTRYPEKKDAERLPDFPLYEYRRLIRNVPKNYEEAREVRVRGVTQAEINGMSDWWVKDFVPK